jgi:UDP-N-acetyl-D-glucosamine dehydrogenase
MKKQLIEKLNNKTATIGIFGLGYIGLPLMIRFTD